MPRKLKTQITNLEATSSKLLNVNPESGAQASISCLPPHIKAAKHSVAFWSMMQQNTSHFHTVHRQEVQRK